MSKHTLGPWLVVNGDVHSESGWEICASGDWGGIITEDDARLIAAAPRLYDALIKLSKGNRSPSVLEIAREALKGLES